MSARGGVAEIDQEIAVQLGDLRVADGQAAAAGGVDQLPGLVAGRILEGRAAGAALRSAGVASRFSVILSISAAIAAGSPARP